MKKQHILVIGSIVFLIDQIIKILVVNFLEPSQSIKIIDKFFHITNVENTGAAWSILSGNIILLILVSIIMIFIIYFGFIKNQKLNKLEIYLYGILYGGVIGNLVDRIFRSAVVDYLEFNIFGYNFPIFNFADICIVVSIIIIVILNLRGEKHETKNSV